MPEATEPQPIATKNSSPDSGLSWNITCPMPRRLRSTKRRVLDASQQRSHHCIDCSIVASPDRRQQKGGDNAAR